MPVPRKRELAAYFLLVKAGRLNLGEAVELVSGTLCTTKRTARNIIKRLKRIGAVKIRVSGPEIIVEPLPPEVFLEKIVSGYIESRSSRCGDEEGRTH